MATAVFPLDRAASAGYREALPLPPWRGLRLICFEGLFVHGVPTTFWEQVRRLTLLEAEPGSAKSEAALAQFAQLFDGGLVDGFYCALPTRSAATQVHARIFAAAKHAFAAPSAVALAAFRRAVGVLRQSNRSACWSRGQPETRASWIAELLGAEASGLLRQEVRGQPTARW